MGELLQALRQFIDIPGLGHDVLPLIARVELHAGGGGNIRNFSVRQILPGPGKSGFLPQILAETVWYNSNLIQMRAETHTRCQSAMALDPAMSSAAVIAVSGIRAASAWMSSAASNLANMQTDGPVPATPPSQPLPQTPGSVYQATTVQQTANSNGSVATSLPAAQPSYLLAYDPQSPLANSQGLVAAPNVDMATQFVNMIEARAAFGANIAALKAADSTTKTLLNMLA